MKVMERRASVGKDVLSLVVAVDVSAQPPFRLIQHFREEQSRRNRIEDAAFQETGRGGAGPADQKIRRYFPARLSERMRVTLSDPRTVTSTSFMSANCFRNS